MKKLLQSLCLLGSTLLLTTVYASESKSSQTGTAQEEEEDKEEIERLANEITNGNEDLKKAICEVERAHRRAKIAVARAQVAWEDFIGIQNPKGDEVDDTDTAENEIRRNYFNSANFLQAAVKETERASAEVVRALTLLMALDRVCADGVNVRLSPYLKRIMDFYIYRRECLTPWASQNVSPAEFRDSSNFSFFSVRPSLANPTSSSAAASSSSSSSLPGLNLDLPTRGNTETENYCPSCQCSRCESQHKSK
jgi:hypothetical protein